MGMTLAQRIAEEVKKVLATKVLGTPPAEEPLHDLAKAAAGEDAAFRSVLEALSDELGTANPEMLAVACLGTLSPLPHAETVEMVKAVLAGGPIVRRPFANLPTALEQQHRDQASALQLRNAAGDVGVGLDHDIRHHSEMADALAMARNMKPMSFDRPTRPDPRAELRELRDEAIRVGNRGGADMLEREIAAAEARQATAIPAAT